MPTQREQQNKEGTQNAKRPQTGERSTLFKEKGHQKQVEENQAKNKFQNQEKRSGEVPGWKKVSLKKER